MAAPERIVPRKFAVVSVAPAFSPVRQYTLHGSPPLIIVTLKLVPVSAPSTRNIQTALAPAVPASRINDLGADTDALYRLPPDFPYVEMDAEDVCASVSPARLFR
jgi:hypothetical protein